MISANRHNHKSHQSIQVIKQCLSDRLGARQRETLQREATESIGICLLLLYATNYMKVRGLCKFFESTDEVAWSRALHYSADVSSCTFRIIVEKLVRIPRGTGTANARMG